jgi:hypothetical protein
MSERLVRDGRSTVLDRHVVPALARLLIGINDSLLLLERVGTLTVMGPMGRVRITARGLHPPPQVATGNDG